MNGGTEKFSNGPKSSQLAGLAAGGALPQITPSADSDSGVQAFNPCTVLPLALGMTFF